MPVEPVPISPTRRPDRSTPSVGQSAERYQSPSNVSSPGIVGCFGTDRQPVAMTANRAEYDSPFAVCRVQRLHCSSKSAELIRVSHWMSRARSNRSTTCSR